MKNSHRFNKKQFLDLFFIFNHIKLNTLITLKLSFEKEFVMPVPKRKTSKARRDKRAAGKKIVIAIVAKCQTCNEPILPHQVCKACGHYKGVKVIRTKTDRLYERNNIRQAKQQASAPAAPPVESSGAESAPAK